MQVLHVRVGAGLACESGYMRVGAGLEMEMHMRVGAGLALKT